MSIVFCDSSQYINRNKSNCGGRKAAVRCFEVCKTSELPARENEVSLFASCKK